MLKVNYNSKNNYFDVDKWNEIVEEEKVNL